jgi:hypothetical protein
MDDDTEVTADNSEERFEEKKRDYAQNCRNNVGGEDDLEIKFDDQIHISESEKLDFYLYGDYFNDKDDDNEFHNVEKSYKIKITKALKEKNRSGNKFPFDSSEIGNSNDSTHNQSVHSVRSKKSMLSLIGIMKGSSRFLL